MGKPDNVAVIGAGMAGLQAARRLVDHGCSVVVFDKGRRAGGRLATRRVDGFTFNHGCQYFSARDHEFAEAVTPFSAPWALAGAGRLTGVPDMAAVAAGLAARLPVRQSAHVRGLRRGADGWRLRFDASEEGPFDALVLAVPALQAAALLDGCGHGFAGRLADVHLAPCWAVMLGFSERQDVVLGRREDGPVSWVADETSRPAAPAAPVGYVVHGAADWSAAHLEDDAGDVIAALQDAAGFFKTPVYAAAHRWRYALADQPLGEAFLWDADQRIGLCGDWCIGGRLEAAYLSGRALGERIAA